MFFKSRKHFRAGKSASHRFGISHAVFHHHPGNAIALGLELIETAFMVNVQEHQQATSERNTQSSEIDQGKAFVFQ